MSVQSISPQILTPPVAQTQKRYPGQAIASFILPGTGQFLKEDNKKSLRDVGIALGLELAIVATGALAAFKIKVAEDSSKKLMEVAVTHGGIMAVLGIGMLANGIHSVIDAYKAKPAKETIKGS